jgi:hypothetical protein
MTGLPSPAPPRPSSPAGSVRRGPRPRKRDRRRTAGWRPKRRPAEHGKERMPKRESGRQERSPPAEGSPRRGQWVDVRRGRLPSTGGASVRRSGRHRACAGASLGPRRGRIHARIRSFSRQRLAGGHVGQASSELRPQLQPLAAGDLMLVFVFAAFVLPKGMSGHAVGARAAASPGPRRGRTHVHLRRLLRLLLAGSRVLSAPGAHAAASCPVLRAIRPLRSAVAARTPPPPPQIASIASRRVRHGGEIPRRIGREA